MDSTIVNLRVYWEATVGIPAKIRNRFHRIAIAQDFQLSQGKLRLQESGGCLVWPGQFQDNPRRSLWRNKKSLSFAERHRGVVDYRVAESLQA